jgi:ABC-type sugar transport system ATPase subunit
MERIEKSFGENQVLMDVNFVVNAGETHALLGENGAGKSTLMKVLIGVYAADGGRIVLDGEDVGDLGFAQRQMVEILKALSRGAKLVVMDEPTSSLTVREEETLFATVDQLKASGIGIVYISHRMADVLRLSDRISIVKDGRLIGPLLPSETSIAHIASLMSRSPESQQKLGPTETVPIQRRAASGAGPPALSVSGLRTARKLSDIAFQIGAGEIVGLAGLVGSGRSTLAKAIFGLIPDAAGAISVAGRPVQTGSVSSAVAAKIGFVPEDRRLEGLVANRSLAENFALTNLTKLSHARGFGPMATQRIASLFSRYRSDLSLLCRGPSQAAQELSGGNQQKVVFAKWLATNPELLILDEPTSGVDINAKRDMRELIRRLAAQGVGVLLISSELEELMELSDRILVMAAGRITRSLERVDDEASLRALLQTDAARQAELRNKEKAA